MDMDMDMTGLLGAQQSRDGRPLRGLRPEHLLEQMLLGDAEIGREACDHLEATLEAARWNGTAIGGGGGVFKNRLGTIQDTRRRARAEAVATLVTHRHAEAGRLTGHGQRLHLILT